MVWGHISGIKSDGEVHTAQEMRFRYRRDGDEGGGVGHTGRVLRGAEYGDAVGRGAEGFDAFIGLLAVVEAGGHAMEAEVWVGHEDWRGPLGGGDRVVGFNVAVH